jgi:hypothetical protein
MRQIIIVGRILAILTIAVGIAHGVMTFMPVISDGLAGLDVEWRHTFTWFSLASGGFIVLCGFLFAMLLRRVERHDFLAAPLVAIGVFVSACGVLAVRYMLTNPFAWVLAGLGLGLWAVAAGIRSKHRER